jgi:starch phosphorylase
VVIVSITPEIALEKSINYAGGLGVLEGDKFYAAGDMGLDYVVLSLYYKRGYTRVRFTQDSFVLEPEEQYEEFLSRLRPGPELTISLAGSTVYVRPWIYEYKTAKAVLFEVICPEWARRLTDRVYIEEDEYEKNLKYVLLAKASAEYIRRFIGLENLSIVDLEESYTSLVLYLLNLKSKARLIIHTPGPWGHPYFPGDMIEREFGVRVQNHQVNMTLEAIKNLDSVIVVSRKQADIIPKIFPESSGKVKAITNGIHLERWMDERLYVAWKRGELTKELLLGVRMSNKKVLESFLKTIKPEVKIEDRIVLTWARRLTRYKRPYFVTRFIEENPDIDAVVIMSGRPHPRDSDGLRYLREIRELSLKIKNFIYVPDYNLDTAKLLVKSSDLWLFTPFSGWEACGTSYMKALVNGVPTLSSRDGGVLEVVIDGVNGWLFGSDLRTFINIYDDPQAREIDEREYKEFSNKLREVVDIYYNDPDRYWRVALNACKMTPELVDIKNALRRYYFEK